MLVLNISLPDKEKDWVLFDTKSGVIAISAKVVNNQMRLLIDCPKDIGIVRKSTIIEQQKEKQNASKTD